MGAGSLPVSGVGPAPTEQAVEGVCIWRALVPPGQCEGGWGRETRAMKEGREVWGGSQSGKGERSHCQGARKEAEPGPSEGGGSWAGEAGQQDNEGTAAGAPARLLGADAGVETGQGWGEALQGRAPEEAWAGGAGHAETREGRVQGWGPVAASLTSCPGLHGLGTSPGTGAAPLTHRGLAPCSLRAWPPGRVVAAVLPSPLALGAEGRAAPAHGSDRRRPPSHPNDEKEGFFPQNHSSSSMNSVVGNHHHNHNHMTDTCMPLMGEERIEMAEPKPHDTECKEVRAVQGRTGWCKGSLPFPGQLPETKPSARCTQLPWGF